MRTWCWWIKIFNKVSERKKSRKSNWWCHWDCGSYTSIALKASKLELGILSEKSGEYYDIKSGKKLADEGRATEQVAAEYIAKPKNQTLRLEIEARVKVAKDKAWQQ